MSDILDPPADDAELLIRWLSELAGPTPDAAVVASLEATCEARGWHPYDAWQALTAAKIRGFDPDMHPRGRDGKFIEKLGLVELFDHPDTSPGQRGQVTKIKPNRKTPGAPDIEVRLFDADGKPGQTITVKPQNVSAAPEKARVDAPRFAMKQADLDKLGTPARPTPYLSQQTDQRGDLEPGRAVHQEMERDFHQRVAEARAKRPLGTKEPAGKPLPPPKPPETPEAKERRLAGEEVKGATDEELARQVKLGPDVWRQAVAKEQANRARRRAEDEGKRQKLIDTVNTAAAGLSTTDAEERARGLDKILAKLRFSIIDTDKVHDHIYPPGESGRWTPERTAQHEAMWDDLLSQVEAANIPQDRDALVLGGLPGAGKSYMLKPGQQAAGFGVVSWEPNGPLPDGATHVSINPDIVKEMLISRGMLPEGISPDLKPMEQVTFLHEESSAVAKMFSQRLGDLGYNVVLDNTMDSEGGMLKRMTPLARQGYKFRGIFADIPQDESLASAKKRYIDAALSPQGGRFVPSSVQGNRQSSKGNLSKNRDAMDSLVEQDWFTEFLIVDNTGVSTRTPKGEVVAQGTGTGAAADRYLPGADAARPKAGPKMPTPPEAAPTIDVTAPTAPAAPPV